MPAFPSIFQRSLVIHEIMMLSIQEVWPQSNGYYSWVVYPDSKI